MAGVGRAALICYGIARESSSGSCNPAAHVTTIYPAAPDADLGHVICVAVCCAGARLLAVAA